MTREMRGLTMPKIDVLIPLQELDHEIHRFKTLRAEKPRELAPLEAKLARAKENVDTLKAEIKALRLEGLKRESNIKEFDDKVGKLVTQSNMARKNDEYQAFQKEISGLKADRGRVEDGLLDIYMQVDEKSKLEKVREGERMEAEREHGAAKAANDEAVAGLDRQISELAARREQLVAGVDKELLHAYDRVLNSKDDGVALAPAANYESVEDEGVERYWGCGGCGVKVTSQDVNELRKGRDIVRCRSCSRILYWKAEPPAKP